MRMPVGPPLQAVCAGDSLEVLDAVVYQPEDHSCSGLMRSCLILPLVYLATFLVTAACVWLLPAGWEDLTLVLGPVALLGPLALALYVWRRGWQWWKRRDLRIEAEGLAHGDWRLPWARVQRVFSDGIGASQPPGTRGVVVVVESEDQAWAFPTRTLEDADRFVAYLETWRPKASVAATRPQVAERIEP